jgi:NAD(P)-dependent dehydrogenase (short-subunit alcohol dehydrogenase family)
MSPLTTPNVVLVTGTSTGIGLEVALQAAAAGHTVVATMRNLDKAAPLRDRAAAAGVELDIRRLDVTDAASIAACVDGVIGDHGRIDALVNNAAAGRLGTLEQDSIDDVRAIMEVNFFGTITTTRAALPHLRAVGGRIVTVSSEGGIVAGAFNEAYCASKFAIEGFMESLAPVAATVGVRVVLVEPGPAQTDFYDNLGIDLPAMVAAAGPYGRQLERHVTHMFERLAASSTQSAAEAAAVIVALLVQEEPPLRVQTSELARRQIATKLADLDGSVVLARSGAWLS